MSSIKEIARFVLFEYKRVDKYITPFELQRVLHFIATKSSIVHERPEERMPFFPEVYREYCMYGCFPILMLFENEEISLPQEIQGAVQVLLAEYPRWKKAHLYIQEYPFVVSDRDTGKTAKEYDDGAVFAMDEDGELLVLKRDGTYSYVDRRNYVLTSERELHENMD